MFKLSKNYNNPRHSRFTRFKNRAKYFTYSIMHELLQCQLNSASLYNFLLLIEAGQFLWFAIHPNYNFLWQTSFSQYPRDVVKYLQVDFLFRQGDISFYYTVLYIFAAVMLAMILCLGFILFKYNSPNRKNSTVLYYLVRLLSLCALLLITVGPLPIFHTFLEAITCEPDDTLKNDIECYAGIHMANTIFGVLGLIFAIAFSFISQLLLIDFNPASDIPFAGPQSTIGFFKLLMKFGLPLYYTLDHDLSEAKTFVLLYAITWFVLLVLRYVSQGYYNESVNIFTTATECIVFWAALTATFQAYIDTSDVDDVGLYFFIIAAPFVAYTYYIIFMQQRWGGMRINVRKMKKVSDIEKFINIACDLVENKEKPQARIELEGLLRYHVRSCRKGKGDCLCSTLSSNIASPDPSGEEKKIWYRFINSLIIDALAKFPKNSYLHLQHAYFQQDRMGNNFKALFELMRTEETRPDIQEEFSIFRYKNIIEKEMMESDIRNSNMRGVDVNMVVHFQEKFVVFQTEIGKSVKMQLSFWQELEQSTPNVQQLLLLGSKITVQAEVVQNSYSELSAINPNHIRTLRIYGNFLKDIMNDSFESQRILEKAEYAEKSTNLDRGFMDTDRLKYSENSKTCIIMCSGNIHTMGKVLDANNETMNLLNFAHSDIIGQNVNQIMPEIIGTNHNAFMNRYFESSVPSVIGKERPVFPMNKAGYIVPCALMIKIYPNLDQGIRVVGFLRKIELNSVTSLKPKVGQEVVLTSLRTHYLMYGGENDEVYAITEGCYDSFGIPASITNGANPEFTIDSIFPDFRDIDDESLKTPQGQLYTIDTTSLPQNFLVGVHSDISMTAAEQKESKEDLSEKQKQARYRSAQVRVTLVDDSNILGRVRYRVLKLVEVVEDANKQAQSQAADNDETDLQKESQHNLEGESEELPSEGDELREQIEETRSEASNFSLSMGEDLRQLKDMKAKISEKNTPASISFLKTAGFVICAMLIGLTASQLDKKSSINSELKYGFKACKVAVERHIYMADINQYSRILYGMEGGYFGTALLVAVRNRLETFISTFDSIEFQVSQATMIQNQTEKDVTLRRVNTYNLQSDGSIMQKELNINQVYYVYLASAARYKSIPFSEFHSTDGNTTAEIAFYYLKRNGISTLRTSSESIGISYMNYYKDRTENFFGFFLGTMIAGFVFVLATILIMLPKIFSVNKTNMKVLSLFGYIVPEEVKKLADKCQQYMEDHLDEVDIQKEYSSYLYSQEENQEKRDNNQEEELEQLTTPNENYDEPLAKRHLASVAENQNESMTSGNQDFTLQMKEFSETEDNRKLPMLSARTSIQSPGRSPGRPSYTHNTHRGMLASTNRTTARDDKPLISKQDGENTYRIPVPQENAKNPKENNENEEEDEELQEYLHERSKKLRNSPDHSKKGAIFRMSFFASIFLIFFLLDFLMEFYFLKNYRRVVTHLNLIATRISDLKYVQLFTQEEIYDNDPAITYPDLPVATVDTVNTRTEYIDKVLENQVKVKESFTESFPTQFNTYFDLLRDFNDNNVCDLYYKGLSTTDYTACNSAGDGKLKLGIIQTETSMLGTMSQLIQDFYDKSNRDFAAQASYLSNGELKKLTYIQLSLRPVQDYLMGVFVDASNDYLDEIYFYEKIKFICFLAVVCVLELFVLLPYLSRLKQQIFRTKALLNMIPMAMLKKNKALKETFISKEVLQALK